MSEVITNGVDLAKNVFQVHGIDAEGSVIVRRQLRTSMDDRHLELETQLLEIPIELSADQMIAVISVAKSLRDSA